MSKDRIVRFLFRNVSAKKDTLHRLIDALDADGDGRVTLGEAAAGLKALWRSALGKVKTKAPKTRTAD